jgi:Flp pilus assembly CpaE family ATPase
VEQPQKIAQKPIDSMMTLVTGGKSLLALERV